MRTEGTRARERQVLEALRTAGTSRAQSFTTPLPAGLVQRLALVVTVRLRRRGADLARKSCMTGDDVIWVTPADRRWPRQTRARCVRRARWRRGDGRGCRAVSRVEESARSALW